MCCAETPHSEPQVYGHEVRAENEHSTYPQFHVIVQNAAALFFR